MIRPFTRVMCAAIVVLALALVMATPVQARPLDASRGTAKLTSSFLAGALNWLNGFLTGKAQASPSSEKTKPTSGTGTGWTGPTVHPYTGACIDPLGNPCPLTPTS